MAPHSPLGELGLLLKLHVNFNVTKNYKPLFHVAEMLYSYQIRNPYAM